MGNIGEKGIKGFTFVTNNPGERGLQGDKGFKGIFNNLPYN